MPGKWIIALLALALSFPVQTRAQATMEWIVLSVTRDAAPSQARVVAPRNYADQLRSRTLRELEIEVPAGALATALEAAHRSRGRIDGVRLQPARQSGPAAALPTLDNVVVTSYSRSADARSSRVKIQFNWDRTGSAAEHEVGHWMGLASEVVLVVPGVAGEQRVQLANPRTFGEQLERGEIDLLVPPGTLRSAIARSGTRRGSGTVRVKVTRSGGATEWVEISDHQWAASSASDDVTKISSITLRFPKASR